MSCPAQQSRTVLVTGASSGIGRTIAERLAAVGHRVYAAVRKDADLRALKLVKNVSPLRLDVTAPATIDAAVRAVTADGGHLYGLVNNAGVATLGGVMDGTEDEFDLVMKVNAYGPYLVTRAFAPLVIAARGRIVTIGSISGILAAPTVSAYCMSKHAIEAFTDALAGEMAPYGVRVSVIEPGSFATRLVANARRRSPAAHSLPDLSGHAKPDCVAAAAMCALFDPTPKRRYLVASMRDEAQATIEKQIEQLVQLNEEHPYTYDRDALVEMLDGALRVARQRASAASAGVRRARA